MREKDNSNERASEPKARNGLGLLGDKKLAVGRRCTYQVVTVLFFPFSKVRGEQSVYVSLVYLVNTH